MKLDVNALRYLSKEEFRTLQAVELGQKNVRIMCPFVSPLCVIVCESLQQPAPPETTAVCDFFFLFVHSLIFRVGNAA